MKAKIPYCHLSKGSLIVASPEIDIGLFFRSVIIICEHNANGSFGIVINKEMELDLPDEIIDMNDFSNPKISIRSGGPIQTNQMMLLHTSEEIPNQTLKICDKVFLGGDLEFLQDSVNIPEGPNIHLCFGYAGWTSGQLEREFLDGSWFLAPATKEYIFHTPTDQLWQKILRDLGGKFASLSMMPEDLSLN